MTSTLSTTLTTKEQKLKGAFFSWLCEGFCSKHRCHPSSAFILDPQTEAMAKRPLPKKSPFHCSKIPAKKSHFERENSKWVLNVNVARSARKFCKMRLFGEFQPTVFSRRLFPAPFLYGKLTNFLSFSLQFLRRSVITNQFKEKCLDASFWNPLGTAPFNSSFRIFKT